MTKAELIMERVLGMVDVDLYAADLNFVFGEADPKEGVAVNSLARLKQEFYRSRLPIPDQVQ